MKEHKNLPKVVEKSEAEIKEIFQVIRESTLPDGTKDFVIRCIELALWFPLQLQNKKISLSRLRKLIFGRGYKKGNNKDKASRKPNGQKDDDDNHSVGSSSQGSQIELSTTEGTSEDENQLSAEAHEQGNGSKKPGHGRMPHSVYEDFIAGNLKVEGLEVGDLCPLECGGKMRNYRPGILVQIKGQNFAQVYKYTIEKLRCDLCGMLVSAQIPPHLRLEKYDASFKAILTLQKYYVAIPFYRQEHFQKLIGFPLPDATQWDLVEQVAGCCYPVFNVLKILAANGKLIHNDDTTVRILEVIKEIKSNPALERTGMYTTGMIAEYDGHQIALFINGRQHAGENLGALLEHRQPDKPPIIQMADALNNNIAQGLETILCNCLSHGFRKFADLVEYFDDECIHIMTLLGKVFDHEAKTKEMSDTKRLSYHQQHSTPVMTELKQYIDKLIDEHLVEPNSELGKALAYMRKHWHKLTKFLTVAGAPIDNNIVERALKIAIRNRKSAMFYKTCYSAGIGGMLTSIIYTCHLAGENAHHYLTVLQLYKNQVLTHAKNWLPWNYRQTLSDRHASANALEHSPPAACPGPA